MMRILGIIACSLKNCCRFQKEGVWQGVICAQLLLPAGAEILWFWGVFTHLHLCTFCSLPRMPSSLLFPASENSAFCPCSHRGIVTPDPLSSYGCSEWMTRIVDPRTQPQSSGKTDYIFLVASNSLSFILLDFYFFKLWGWNPWPHICWACTHHDPALIWE